MRCCCYYNKTTKSKR